MTNSDYFHLRITGLQKNPIGDPVKMKKAKNRSELDNIGLQEIIEQKVY